MQVLRIAEFDYEEVEVGSLVQDGLLDVQDSVLKYFEFRFRGRRLAIRPMGFIGLIHLNSEIAVDVQPRVDTDVSRILEVSGNTPTMLNDVLRYYVSRGELLPSLLEVFAHSLELAIERVVERGFIRSYVPIVESTSNPTGRVLLDRTVRNIHSRGISHEVVQQRFVRSIDVDVNRLLVDAVRSLGMRCIEYEGILSGTQRNNVSRVLNRCLLQLRPIAVDSRPASNPHVRYSESPSVGPMRSYYANAIALAETIIAGTGVSLDVPTGTIEMRGLVLRMATAFENYVREVLRREAINQEAPMEVLNGNLMSPDGGGLESIFDDSESRPVTPDIVVQGTNDPSECHLIIDVKYKMMSAGLNRKDLNQILVYGLVYKSSKVLIVQPAAQASRGLERMGSVSGITVYRYGLDISTAGLLDREVTFVEDVLELLEC